MVSSGCVERGRGRARRSTRGARVCSARRGGARPARRGPTPALSDAQLLAAIRTDLARSPFQGEGHRKVHARLRILDDIRVFPDEGVAGDARAGATLAAPRAAG